MSTVIGQFELSLDLQITTAGSTATIRGQGDRFKVCFRSLGEVRKFWQNTSRSARKRLLTVLARREEPTTVVFCAGEKEFARLDPERRGGIVERLAGV